MVIRRRQQSQLGEDARHVGLDGPCAEVHPVADRLVGSPFGHQGEHLPFPKGELVEGTCLPRPAHQVADHFRVDHRPPFRHPAHRVQEVLNVRHPIFEQVANTFGPLTDQPQANPTGSTPPVKPPERGSWSNRSRRVGRVPRLDRFLGDTGSGSWVKPCGRSAAGLSVTCLGGRLTRPRSRSHILKLCGR